MMGNVFDGIIEGLEQALDHARGRTVPGLREHQVASSLVSEARERAGLTQAEMATVLGASLGTVRKWERGERQPSGAARTLVRIMHADPDIVLKAAGWTTPAENAPAGRRRSKPRRKAR